MKYLKPLFLFLFAVAAPLALFYQSLLLKEKNDKLHQNELTRLRDSSFKEIVLDIEELKHRIAMDSVQAELIKQLINKPGSSPIINNNIPPANDGKYSTQLAVITEKLTSMEDSFQEEINSIRDLLKNPIPPIDSTLNNTFTKEKILLDSLNNDINRLIELLVQRNIYNSSSRSRNRRLSNEVELTRLKILKKLIEYFNSKLR